MYLAATVMEDNKKRCLLLQQRGRVYTKLSQNIPETVPPFTYDTLVTALKNLIPLSNMITKAPSTVRP